VTWHDILKQPAEWYRSAEARAIADHVLQFQTESGGWPKNADMTQPPSAEFLASTAADHARPPSTTEPPTRSCISWRT